MAEQATETEKSAEQTVTIDDIGPGRKCLTIEIPGERITSTLEEGYEKLKTDAQIPGFRKGRAPMRLIQKRFGTSVKDDVRGQLISDSFSQACQQENLDVIGEPDIPDIDDLKLPDQGPMTFKVEVEVAPQVELPAFEELKVEKVASEVTDADMDQELDDWRLRYGETTELLDAKIQKRDYVKCDVRIYSGENGDDSAELLAHHPDSYALVHGKDHDYKGHIAGIMIDDLGKKLTGKTVGDQVTISMTGPSAHENEDIKGKPITLKIEIESVQRVEPADDQMLLEQTGVDALDDLKQQIRQMLQSRRQAEQTAQMHEQLCQQLAERVDLQLPQGLTGRQTERALYRRKMDMAMIGISEQEIEKRMAQLRTSSEEDACKQLKQFFILTQAAKTLEVEVSEAEVNGRVAMMATQRGQRPEKMRQMMQKSGELEHLYLQIREHKTLDTILQKANVVEKPIGAAEAPQSSSTRKKKKSTGKNVAAKTAKHDTAD